MKIGSLVECIKGFPNTARVEPDIIVPVEGEVYTVRDLIIDGCVRLEEIDNPKKHYRQGIMEAAWIVTSFREVQPPMDLSELLKQTTPVTVDNERYFQLEQQNINHSAH